MTGQLPRLRMVDVKKRFGATEALRGVSFEVAAGTVHALIGENGAGKSTLMKILSGVHRPDHGTMELAGGPFSPSNPLDARRAGIAMIYQELNLAPHLSVEENILLGQEPSAFGWIRSRRRGEIARAALAEIGHEDMPLERPVNRLTIAEQQLVEVARALTQRPKVLVMDEPTSSLTQVDMENLFRVIQDLRKKGVSIVYISHFLEECKRAADRYTVLRDGETVDSGEMASADLNSIIHRMVGREMEEIYPRGEHQIGEPVLELRQLAGETKPRSVDMTLRRGEILGVAGLVGAGRTETLRVCFGLDRLCSGKVVVLSRESSAASPARRLAQGMGLLSENRKEEGLLLNRSIADNLTLTRFQPMCRWGVIREKAQRQAAQVWMHQLDVRAESPAQSMRELSGGNQQKVALGRLLHHEADILLLDEPTRGIDVGSKAQIYHLMGRLATQGKAIVFVSSYLPELLGVCDTIAVMCRGKLADVRPVGEWTEHAIIKAAVGQVGAEKANH